MKKPKTATNEFPSTYIEPVKYSRFDFENQFMNCWSIVDDLRSTLGHSNQDELVEAIITLYSHKFDKCFSTFEELLRTKQIWNFSLDSRSQKPYNNNMNSRNKRKFRIWDSNSIFQGYERAIQIAARIEETCSQNNSPQDLPMSLVPTDVLYDLMICYHAMYNKLLDESLIQNGYPKTTTTKH
jgi:hypothetical protein